MIFSRNNDKPSILTDTDNITGNGISTADATNNEKEQNVIPEQSNKQSDKPSESSNEAEAHLVNDNDVKNNAIATVENNEQDKQEDTVIRFKYWVPKPTLASWRVFGMTIVNIATAIGLCSFAILGFAFVQIGEVSESIRWWLILIGSIALAIGSEVGTLVTVVEIFRKQKSVVGRPILARVLISILATARSIRVVIDALGKIYKAPVEKSFREAIKMIESTLKGSEKGTTVWDWIGLCISVLTSLSAVALAQVSILQLTGSEAVYQWLPTIQQWSPLALALFGVLDGYVNHMEFGRYLSDFDDSVRKWYADRESARRELADIESCGTRKKRGKRNER